MKILLAEDEHDLKRALVAVLTHTGYDVDAVENGAEAVKFASKYAYDCMVLDIMMPVMNGMEALSKIREAGDRTPVIFLTAKAEVEDRINGLDAGADDYLTKPFAIGELIARIKSLTRRQETYTPKVLEAGNVTLDINEQEIKCENAVRLGVKEAKLMEYFMLNKGKMLSTDMIFNHVWKDDDDASIDLVYVYVSYLNSKLNAIGSSVMIEGEEGAQYHLVKRQVVRR